MCILCNVRFSSYKFLLLTRVPSRPFPKLLPIRKLEKAVAVSGVCSGVLEENCGKVPGKLLENFSRIAKCYKFQDFGHRERQTCREPWAHTAGTLSPPSVRGCFLKSTVPAFSSSSDSNSKTFSFQGHAGATVITLARRGLKMVSNGPHTVAQRQGEKRRVRVAIQTAC